MEEMIPKEFWDIPGMPGMLLDPMDPMLCFTGEDIMDIPILDGLHRKA